MLPNNVANKIFANAERAGEGFLGGSTGSDGYAEASGPDFGAELQKPCSAASAPGRNDEVCLWENETGSAGGKLGSSSWCSSLARSKGFSTTKLSEFSTPAAPDHCVGATPSRYERPVMFSGAV